MVEEQYLFKNIQSFKVHQIVFFIIILQIPLEVQFLCANIQLIPVRLIVFSRKIRHIGMVEPF
jgi:hypothetical protein